MNEKEILSDEASVLGDLLEGPGELLPRVVKIFGDLGESIFYSPVNRVIYKAILELNEKGKPIHAKIVNLWLKAKLSRGKLKEEIPLAYLRELVYQGQGAAVSEELAKRLRGEAVRRKTKELGLRIAEKVKMEDQETLDVIEEAQEGLTDLRKSLVEKANPITARELLETSLPKEEYLIGEGLLPKHGYTMLVGKAKEGKTMLALSMILCLAAGVPFLTKKGDGAGFPVPEPKKTLFLLRENTDQTVQTFLTRQKEGLEEQWEKDLTKSLDLIRCFRPKATYLDIKTGLRELRSLLDEYRADLVVMDPLSRFLTSDMNKMETAIRVANAIDELGEEFGCAFLLLHHFRKEGKGDEAQEDAFERITGSAGWRNSYVSCLALERRHKGRSRNIKRLSFEFRGHEPMDPITVERDPETLLFEQITEEEAFEGTSSVGGLVEILEEFKEGARYCLISEVASEKFGVTKRRITELLKKGVEEGLIAKEKGKEGKYYALSQGKLSL